MATLFKVYWTVVESGCSYGEVHEDMSVALKHTQTLRGEGHRFVSMVSESTDQVGQMGVSAVIDGKLPNGEDYTWKKRRL